MAEGKAVRKRRVRLFELIATFLLVATAVISAITWSDFSAGPMVDPQYVSFPSTDGVTISGALFLPHTRSGPLPGVVVVHGITDHKEYLNRISVELARADFVVLAIDLRAHGMSNGVCTFGLPGAEPMDVANAVAFLKGRPEVDPNHIGLVGHSFGGMVSLTALGLGSTRVNATVTWAAPINLSSLARDNYETVAYVADKRVLPPDLLNETQLAIRSPITYLGNLTPNSTLFLHSADDELVPVSQVEEARNATAGQNQTVDIVTGVKHAMDTPEIVDKTVSFLELKLKGRTSPLLAPAYPTFQRDATWLLLALTMLSWPMAWLSWEFICTRNPQLVRQFTYPADTSRVKALAFAGADVAAFGGAVFAVGALVVPGSAAAPFAGVLPAPSLFVGVLLAGLALCAFAFVLARAERSVRGRDEKRFEEGESFSRSIRVAVPVLLLIPFTAALQYALFLGYNVPRSLAFVLPVLLLGILMFGLEAFIRLRVQRRLRSVMALVFPKMPLANALVSVLLGTVLFFIALTWVVMWLFRGYMTAPGDAALLTLAVGIVSSIFYDRTKSIVPGALFSSIFITWVLNGPFHF